MNRKEVLIILAFIGIIFAATVPIFNSGAMYGSLTPQQHITFFRWIELNIFWLGWVRPV